MGAVTTTGQVTNYSGPGISNPGQITAGPDGALWFTNFGGNSIGRITTTGTVTSNYSGVSAPAGITAGPDGALWFTNIDGNSIGRITVPPPHKIISTRTFAGYQTAVAAGSATSSAARFTVPKLSCGAATRAIGPAAGVEVNNNQTFSSAFLFTGCVNGKSVDFPALVINGSETNYPKSLFSAGDVISLSTKVTTAGTTVQARDASTGVTRKLTGAGAAASAAYIGDSAWFTSGGALLGVPNFGTLTFTNCLIDGGALAVSLPSQYQRVNSSSTVQIATGSLSPGGTTFATTYNHS